MKPLRKHVALAIDGGGIRGTMVAKALAVVEAELGQSWSDIVELTAGTSAGSIIAAAIAARLPAARLHELYVTWGQAFSRRACARCGPCRATGIRTSR